MDIQYVPKGKKGKCCSDCKNFENEQKGMGIGTCFGNQVQAEGSCNFFEPKK